MTAPRLQIDLTKIEHNAKVLVRRLGAQGIRVTGVTKATLGYGPVANAMRRGGVWGIGDSRLRNMQTLQRANGKAGDDVDGTTDRANASCPLWLLRSPMLSEAASVVTLTDISSNTELDVIDALSAAATQQALVHGVVLMIELGDLREGILPGQLHQFIRRMLRFPGIRLQGIGTNLACLSGVIPDERNMAELSRIAQAVEHDFALTLQIVSGGNSANLNWAAGVNANRSHINNLRLGEAILLGRESIQRQPVPGLHTDAFSLIAEVIESKRKAVLPQGTIGQPAIMGAGRPPQAGQDLPDPAATRHQAILALGAQDTDPQGLTPPAGIRVLGASSDHLIIDTANNTLRIGSELAFEPNYSALMRAMTSPFVTREIQHQVDPIKAQCAYA